MMLIIPVGWLRLRPAAVSEMLLKKPNQDSRVFQAQGEWHHHYKFNSTLRNRYVV